MQVYIFGQNAISKFQEFVSIKFGEKIFGAKVSTTFVGPVKGAFAATTKS
jgi:hypothetical protein